MEGIDIPWNEKISQDWIWDNVQSDRTTNIVIANNELQYNTLKIVRDPFILKKKNRRSCMVDQTSKGYMASGLSVALGHKEAQSAFRSVLMGILASWIDVDHIQNIKESWTEGMPITW